MPTEFDFMEVERCENCFIPSITYKNDYHTVTIFYDDPDHKMVDITTHKGALALQVISDTVYIKDVKLTGFTPDEINDIIQELKTTQESARQLQDLLTNRLPQLRFED